MITRKNGQTCVSYFVFPGMTDPISLAILSLLSFLIFFFTGTPYPVLFAFGWTIAVALTTALCTVFSALGQNGAASLDEFLTIREIEI